MKILMTLLVTLNVYALDYKVACSSNNYAGDSVAAAVEACATHTNSRRDRCTRDVTCITYKTHCESYNYAGDNVQKAIEACTKYSNRDRRNCTRNISCK